MINISSFITNMGLALGWEWEGKRRKAGRLYSVDETERAADSLTKMVIFGGR